MDFIVVTIVALLTNWYLAGGKAQHDWQEQKKRLTHAAILLAGLALPTIVFGVSYETFPVYFSAICVPYILVTLYRGLMYLWNS